MSSELEEGLVEKLDFGKLAKVAGTGSDVLPVVAQDADSGMVLIIAYANRKALERTMLDGVAVFWSTSRNELWIKGATSGNYLDLVEIRVNCEQNALLYLVRPRKEGVCHTKSTTGGNRKSCFYRKIRADRSLEWVEELR